MYGFVNYALELLVTRRFGQKAWKKIREKAELNGDGRFLVHCVYDDDITYRLVGSASRVQDLEANDILEQFGEMFFIYCREAGYDRILQLLGGSLYDFLCNLDFLHDHLSSVYPGMCAPSFRVVKSHDSQGLLLYYYSEREGLQHIVKGIVKTVAKQIHDVDVSVDILSVPEEGEKSRFLIKTINPADSHHLHPTFLDSNKNILDFSSEAKVSPYIFAKVFPFHVIFDRNMNILQLGTSLSRVINLNSEDSVLTDYFEMIRPQLYEFTFDSILRHINTVFVLKTECERKNNMVILTIDEPEDEVNSKPIKGYPAEAWTETKQNIIPDPYIFEDVDKMSTSRENDEHVPLVSNCPFSASISIEKSASSLIGSDIDNHWNTAKEISSDKGSSSCISFHDNQDGLEIETRPSPEEIDINLNYIQPPKLSHSIKRTKSLPCLPTCSEDMIDRYTELFSVIGFQKLMAHAEFSTNLNGCYGINEFSDSPFGSTISGRISNMSDFEDTSSEHETSSRVRNTPHHYETSRSKDNEHVTKARTRKHGTTSQTSQRSTSKDGNQITSLRLKGQMVYLEQTDTMLFLCSPSVSDINDLKEKGLYLSDIPVHDATRDLVLLSENFRSEYHLTQQLELISDELTRTFKELEEEMTLSDKLLYSVLPPTVADALRMQKPIEAESFESVTLLFSGIVDFSKLCHNLTPIETVDLLNNIYTRFDVLADHLEQDVYKVETIGDKYMAVSGLPTKCSTHAKVICSLAMDMMDVTKVVNIKGGTVQITIGIHSGEVVAGVIGQRMPRYCLFGNTVNLTSRTETTGEKGKINMTDDTYRLLLNQENFDPSFLIRRRGEISMKGRSKLMVTYTLQRDRSLYNNELTTGLTNLSRRRRTVTITNSRCPLFKSVLGKDGHVGSLKGVSNSKLVPRLPTFTATSMELPMLRNLNETLSVVD